MRCTTADAAIEGADVGGRKKENTVKRKKQGYIDMHSYHDASVFLKIFIVKSVIIYLKVRCIFCN